MIRLRVYGDPAPQGSKRHVGNGRMVEASKKVGPWRKAVSEAVDGLALFEPLDGPLEVDVTFYVPRPRSVKRMLPHVPPDLDKLLRGLFDALTIAGVWVDDSLVVRVYAAEFYADIEPPGCEVSVARVEDLVMAVR
ncbi:MAG TPA: RusA family crossover junction endodeoxyribonuclease [Sideroxyarcus sp.]|nr:RusA family crossover junction endodeoxyribonuclease [Sideroxyarcus sp.]